MLFRSLLHLTGILGAKDDHLHAFEVDLHGGCRRHALGEAVGRELSSIVDDKVRLAKVCELLLSGANQHVILRSAGAPSIGAKVHE